MIKGKYTLKEQIMALEKEVTKLVTSEMRKHEIGIPMTDKWRNHVWALRYALETLRNVDSIQDKIKIILKNEI